MIRVGKHKNDRAIFIDAQENERVHPRETRRRFRAPLGSDDAGPTGSPGGPSCPSAHWWRDPECIESRIFADFRRASFAHGLPRVLPGARHQRSVYCVAAWTAGGLQPPTEEPGRAVPCVPSATHTRSKRTRSLFRSLASYHGTCAPVLRILERAHSISSASERARHMVLLCPDQRPRSRPSSTLRSRWPDQ